jgi:hypothetical protein
MKTDKPNQARQPTPGNVPRACRGAWFGAAALKRSAARTPSDLLSRRCSV